jgi:hypothetical protein
MPELAEYKIIRGSLETLEKQANELSAYGWRVITSISLANWEVALVLELQKHE